VFVPPAALDMSNVFNSEKFHHPDGKYNLLHAITLIIMKPPGHGYYTLSPDRSEINLPGWPFTVATGK